MQSSKRVRARLLRWLPVALLGWLVVHFAFTLAFLTPVNPIKLRQLAIINRYMLPLFEQHWELFAPDPLVDTRLLLVSCRLRDDAGGIDERPYSNMTAAYRELKHRYRLTPADRLERAQFAPIHLMFGEQDAIAKRVRQHAQDLPELERVRQMLDEQQAKRAKDGARLLGRVASAECDRLYGRGRATEVQVRMAIIKSPPFSKRALPTEDGETTYSDFPWMPYEEVAPL